MSPSFLSDQFDTMYNVPSYRTWFLQQDLRPAYKFHRRFLQHLQQRKKALRWILKAPTHLFALPALLSVYPDARFVQTHREPTEAITSVSSLITILRRIFSNEVDPRKVAREAWRYWAEAMAKFLRDRDRFLASERICDLKYADIRHDPMDAVRYIYAYFGWPFSAVAEECIERSLRNQPREQNGFHRYQPSQFKLDMMDREQDFGAYCARFGLTPERRSIRLEPTLARAGSDRFVN
jgi:Sulfotransferase family